MKQLVSLLLISLVLSSCHKDKSSGNPILLSKVFSDGLLSKEYLYSSDRKPVRRNSYNINNGQSTLSLFRLYEYSSDGLLSTITDFAASTNNFSNKYSLQYDVNKRLTRMNDLSNANAIQFYYVFDYDAAGNMTQYSLFNAGTNKKTFEASYTYTPQGTISKIIRYSFLPAQVKHDSATYVFENKKLPTHWNYFEALPVVGLPNGDTELFYLFCDSAFYYFVDAPPSITTRNFSEKALNGAGLPVKQRMDFTSESGFGPSTGTTLFTYEYIN